MEVWLRETRNKDVTDTLGPSLETIMCNRITQQGGEIFFYFFLAVIFVKDKRPLID